MTGADLLIDTIRAWPAALRLTEQIQVQAKSVLQPGERLIMDVMNDKAWYRATLYHNMKTGVIDAALTRL